ncbi:hypothetical protein C7271_22460 [filamentous cyanobacterium CCP5]|nr:hypothetical protein C7271_22460 [filamentous cyanobacterium CCP5]
MFAPYPMTEDGWYVIPGILKNGTEVDLFRQGKKVIWQKPDLVSKTYGNDRWRKYMLNIWLRDNADYRLYYGQYLCRKWNRDHFGGQQLDRFKIYYMLEETLPNYQPPKVEKVVLWEHYCFEYPPELDSNAS